MSNWNPWENQLRSWKLRPASAKLRESLFARTAPAPDEHWFAAWGNWRWLAPALGCFVLSLTLLSPPSSQIGYLAEGGTNLLVGLGNQRYAAYLVDGFHSRQN